MFSSQPVIKCLLFHVYFHTRKVKFTNSSTGLVIFIRLLSYEYNFRERDYPTCFVEEKEENEQDHRYSYENRRPQRYKTNRNISKPTRQRWLRMFPPWKHQNKQAIHLHQLWLRSTRDFKTRVSCGLALPADYRSRVQTRDKHMIDIQEATCYHDM